MEKPKKNKDTMSILIYGFIIFGLLGRLIPLGSINAFRFFHVWCALIVAYSFFRKTERATLQFIAIAMPLMLYLCICNLLFEININNSIFNSDHMLKLILLISLFISTVVMAAKLKKESIDEKFNIVVLYLKIFIVTAIIGMMFFVGYYLKIIPVNFISQFQVQLQFGAGGLLRVSPGSYPNEYGTVASFAMSIFTLLLFNKDQLKNENTIFTNKKNNFLFIASWILTLVVLFLATTRSAYASFAIALIYIIFTNKKVNSLIKSILKITFLFIVICIFVQAFVYDINSHFIKIYNSTFENGGNSSIQKRYEKWDDASEYISENLFFGIGYGKNSTTHNVYLQLPSEIGVVGIVILIITFILLGCSEMMKTEKIFLPPTVKYELLLKVKNIAIIHVLWFATNNHNLNHHLTWFCILLILSLRYKIVNQEYVSRKKQEV